jgi:hypothetical protein
LTDITNTKLLTCQSNRFVDNSSIGDTFNLTGTPKVTPFSPFKNDDARDITTDGGSAFFSASQTNNQLILADNDKFHPGSSDFTLEAWVYTVGVVGSDYQAIWSKWTAGGQEIFFTLTPTLQLQFNLWFGSNTAVVTTKTMNANEWNHVAATRNGGTVTLWINGQSEATISVSGSVTNNANSVYVGNYEISSYYEFNGYISDVRWVKGTAVYTSAFTPPTSPLTAITNTETLLNFQDAGIYDLSGINNVNTVGNAQIDTAVVKYGTGSLEFDGTGDYLVLTDDSTLSMGTGDFTVEFWSYCTGTGYRMVLDNNWDSTTNAWQIYINGEDTEILHANGASSSIGVSTAGNAVPNNQWTHLAFVKSGTTVKIYVNGTSTASGTMNVTFGRDSTNYIGIEAGSSYPFVGYIDDLRITKGIARYTADFTPPDAALPKF